MSIARQFSDSLYLWFGTLVTALERRDSILGTAMDRKVMRRIVLIAALIAFTMCIGTAGFHFLEGYSGFDAFYMTLITISTVGYQEIRPLSQAGRIFNSFLILFGVSAMFFAVGVMTQTIIELQLQDRYGKRRIRRAVIQMKDHHIVCGFGRVGRNAALELQRAGAPFLVVDRSEQRVERAVQSGMIAMHADATRDESLREAGVERARGFIAALATDADNVFVILSAKTLNPGLAVVTRASEEDAEQKLRRAGADTVFSPYSITGHRLAQALVRPHVLQLLDFGSNAVGLDLTIEQLSVTPGSSLVPKTLANIARLGDAVIVLALKKSAGQMIFNPDPGIQVSEGDVLIVMGEHSSLRKLENALSKS
jgi:voltage-gated potassium channel